jgi:hypothetical protein
VVQVLGERRSGVEVGMGSQVQEMVAADDMHLEAGHNAGHRLLQEEEEDIDSRDE